MVVLNKDMYLSQLPGTCRLYKLLGENYTNKNFIYKIGLNEDHIPFNPSGECSEGGLYFFDETQLINWRQYAHGSQFIACIQLVDDSVIYLEKGKQKTNKFEITSIHPWKENLREYVNFNNTKICELAIRQNGLALQYVEEQTEEMCKLAVQQEYLALKYVKCQTYEICRLAVRQNGSMLQYVALENDPLVDGPYKEVCKIAVQQNGFALQYVTKQTDEICKLAVQQNGLALQCVEEQTPEICKLAVQQNGSALLHVKNQTDELCKLAVQKDGYVLGFVLNKTEEICNLAQQQIDNPQFYTYVSIGEISKFPVC